MSTRTPPPQAGETFARWTVTGDSFFQSPGHRAVPCRCECGTEQDVLVFALRSGKSESCGCLKQEQVATLVSRTRWRDSHGRAAGDKDPLYRLWQRIKRRCYNPNTHNYGWYGGRGIGMFDPWRTDAGAFIAYIEDTLGPRPPGYSINRIDNDGDYEPGNLEWASAAKQAANRRSCFDS